MTSDFQPGFQDSPSFDEALLDFHLGRLEPQQQQALRARIASDSTLRAQHEALASVFAALSRYDVPTPPADLAQRVSRRVAQTPRLAVRRSAPTPVRGDPPITLLPMQTVRDIAAVAAVVVLMIGVGVPGVLHMRERSNRTLCSMNLGQIGQGLSSYASVFGDSLPFAGWSSRSSWKPTSEPNAVVAPNRRHVYALVRASFVPTQSFVCPSTTDQPMPSEQIARSNDFLEARNISYAAQNMAGARPRLGDAPTMPILGDDNPFFDNGLPLFDAIRGLGLADASQFNSRAHRAAGQNLLSLGGTVRWTSSPDCGVDGDNVWTLRDVSQYTGREGPSLASDSHLLK